MTKTIIAGVEDKLKCLNIIPDQIENVLLFISYL